MTNYATKLTKEDLMKYGIKDIWYDTNEAKYHIISKAGNEIKPHKNKQDYLSLNLYVLDDDGSKIKIPTTRKYKGAKKETDTYYYKLMPVTLSRCVYAWFHGEVPEGLIVDHIDNKHDTHYDNRLENLQLKTPAENLAKERPVCRTEIPCDMTKPLEYYIDNYNYWTLEYQKEKEERSSYTEYAHKCRSAYSVYRKKIRYWFKHQKEYEDYIKLESARISAREYQQERAAKVNIYIEEIRKAKEISKELWRQKIKEYSEFQESHPFKTQKELEKMFLEEVIK